MSTAAGVPRRALAEAAIALPAALAVYLLAMSTGVVPEFVVLLMLGLFVGVLASHRIAMFGGTVGIALFYPIAPTLGVVPFLGDGWGFAAAVAVAVAWLGFLAGRLVRVMVPVRAGQH